MATKVESGEWAGWSTWAGLDPFEDMAGPFYFKKGSDGKALCSFRVEKKHLNGGGNIHGGCLMTFADFCLFAIAEVEAALHDSPAVTISLNGDFSGPATEGDILETTGHVVKSGKSIIFVRGMISNRGEPVLPFSGVIKRLKVARL